MEKIFFGGLNLEITRRCQLKCAHCLRGDAQDVDMSKEVIDSILDQCAGIFDVFFTGGEPTLNIDAMDYFLREVQRRNIPLGGLGFVTNGISIPDTLKEFLLRAYDYITACRTSCEAFRIDATIAKHYRINIGISVDNYHTGSNPEAAKEIYKSFLPNEGCWIYANSVNSLIREGRAKNIKEAHSVPFLDGFPKIQIGIAYKGHTPICGDCIRINEMAGFCDAYIPCQLVVTAKGKILPFIQMQFEYQTEDETLTGICQYSGGLMPSIIESVRVYNRGALPCYVGYNIPLRVESDKLFSAISELRKENLNSNQYFDPLFLASKREIERLIHTSEAEYDLAYVHYFMDRIPKYSNEQDFIHDFPYSNDYFYQKLRQTMMVMDTPDVVQWIVENKDYLWYRVDDELVPMAKSLFKQFIIQGIREDTNGLWGKDISMLIKYQLDKIPYLNE